LTIVSGPYTGLTLETLSLSSFTATNLSLPIPVGTVFTSDQTTDLYVKSDPTSTFAAGALFGTASDRTVTITGYVPEPSTFILASIAAVLVGTKSFRRQERGRESLS